MANSTGRAGAGHRPTAVSAGCRRSLRAGEASRTGNNPPGAGRLPGNGRYPRSRPGSGASGTAELTAVLAKLSAAAPALPARPVRQSPPIADTSEPNASRGPVSRSSRSFDRPFASGLSPGRDGDGGTWC